MKRKPVLVFVLVLALMIGSLGTAEEVFNAGSEVSREEALRVYLSGVLYDAPKSGGPGSGAARKNLSQAEQKLYDQVLEQAKKVAAGEQEDTEFRFVMGDYFEDKSATPEEIGFPGLMADDEQSFGQAYFKAWDALTGNFDLLRVLMAVKADHPYELYWTDQYYHSFSNTILARIGEDGAVECFVLNTGTEEMPVQFTAGYTVDTAFSADGKIGFKARTEIGAAVQKAAENARRIVEAHAGESDVQKLKSYKDEICRMVKYNDEAAAKGVDAYGTRSPWSLIWALDGDETTNVVCEGYAQAFQYLCELSSFSSPLVRSIYVNGYCGGENHAWNVVRLSDGENYLADVTNSDEDTGGSEGTLFLARYADKKIEGIYTGYFYDTGFSYLMYQFDEDTKGLYSSSDLRMAGPEEHNEDEITDMPGDVNDDGTVDGRDAIRLMKYLAEEEDPETGEPLMIQENNADVNGDGAVDEKDLLRLMRYLGGEDVELLAGAMYGNG